MGVSCGYELGVKIPVENLGPALEAVNVMVGPPRKDGYTDYAWVTMPVEAGPGGVAHRPFRSLAEALDAFRFSSSTAADGGVEVGEFTRDPQKLGDEESLFAALAPFVDPGSVVYGECDGSMGGKEFWKWTFEGGALRSHPGTYE